MDIADPVVGTEPLALKTNLLPGALRIAHHEHVADGVNNGHTIQINYEGATRSPSATTATIWCNTTSTTPASTR